MGGRGGSAKIVSGTVRKHGGNLNEAHSELLVNDRLERVAVDLDDCSARESISAVPAPSASSAEPNRHRSSRRTLVQPVQQSIGRRHLAEATLGVEVLAEIPLEHRGGDAEDVGELLKVLRSRLCLCDVDPSRFGVVMSGSRGRRWEKSEVWRYSGQRRRDDEARGYRRVDRNSLDGCRECNVEESTI